MSPPEPTAIVEDLTALSTAVVDLREAGLGPTGVAGVCLIDPGTIRVEHAVAEVEAVFTPGVADMDPATAVTYDRLDQPWLVLETTADRFEELVVALAFAVESIYRRGYGDYAFLAAVELESPHDGRLYLFYRFDERGYYPFAPRPGGRHRHRGLERRVTGVAGGTLPVLADDDAWTPLWGVDGDDHPWATGDRGSGARD